LPKTVAPKPNVEELEEPAPKVCDDLTGYSAYGRNVEE
jgi:hypothetical protein